MPITWDNESQIFHLANATFSYALFINSKGVLQHLYYGKPLSFYAVKGMCDFGWDWSNTYLEAGTEIEKRYKDAYFNDRALSELASHGLNDKRGAPLIVRQENGENSTQFIYQSHRIYQGKPVLAELPSSYAKEQMVTSLEITAKDIFSGVTLLLTYTLFDNLPILLRNGKIINTTEEPVVLERAYSLAVDFPRSDFLVHHFPGDWCMERQYTKHALTDGLFRIESNYGRSSHEENPFVILSDKTVTESTGEAYAFSFVYSGNFAIDIKVDKWKATRVMMGINDEDFGYRILPKESFELPEGVMVYSQTGLASLSLAMHDFIRQHIVRFQHADKKRPVLFNSWEGCYLDFTTQRIKDFMIHAKNIGAELFVLDDGWFGKRDEDTSSLGDWFVNEDKIKLEEVITFAKSLQLQFGIWFEPEMVNPDSDFYRKNSAYVLGSKQHDRMLSRHQLVIDMSVEDAVNQVYAQMCAILDRYDIAYVKWDHNRSICETISKASRFAPKEKYHAMMLGSYRLMRQLQERYPTICFEGCASGGGRFDLGILCYAPQIWTSDETDPIQRLFIQYGTSFAYPLSTIGAHVSKSKMTGYRTKAEIALFGTYGYELNPTLLNEQEKSEILHVTEWYHRYHEEIILNGDCYRLKSPFEDNAMAMISVAKNQTKALVLYVQLLKENARYRFLKLRGLHPQKSYKNSFDHQVYTGEYYHQVGINLLRWLDEFSSFCIILEEVNDAKKDTLF